MTGKSIIIGYKVPGNDKMKLLEDRIRQEGEVRSPEILKVDSFLNHRIDVSLMDKLGEEFFRLFAEDNVTKILTIEASGIGIACLTARHFEVPVVFAKKSVTSNMSGENWSTKIWSFTHNREYSVVVSKKYLDKDDRVLIIDDFLAEGNALTGLIGLVKDAGAYVVGAGIVIEKGFQPGGEKIRQSGIRVESLAIIESMDPVTGITFREQ